MNSRFKRRMTTLTTLLKRESFRLEEERVDLQRTLAAERQIADRDATAQDELDAVETVIRTSLKSDRTLNLTSMQAAGRYLGTVLERRQEIRQKLVQSRRQVESARMTVARRQAFVKMYERVSDKVRREADAEMNLSVSKELEDQVVRTQAWEGRE